MGLSAAPLRYTPGRWMLFVDGENLTIRSQELAKDSGYQLIETFRYKRDCYVWPVQNAQQILIPVHGEPLPLRSFYYTSLRADHDGIEKVRANLWQLGFEPHVFKRHRDGVKAK